MVLLLFNWNKSSLYNKEEMWGCVIANICVISHLFMVKSNGCFWMTGYVIWNKFSTCGFEGKRNCCTDTWERSLEVRTLSETVGGPRTNERTKEGMSEGIFYYQRQYVNVGVDRIDSTDVARKGHHRESRTNVLEELFFIPGGCRPLDPRWMD